ncbi:Pycsar system effector family protein [Streptomyces sp. NPDC002640]
MTVPEAPTGTAPPATEAPVSGPGAAGPATEAGPARARLEICERLLTDLRAEITRADQKASVLVAALGITAGAFSGLVAGEKWSPADLSDVAAALWWTGGSALVVSLASLLLAVVPRYRRSTWAPGDPLSYFGDIRQAVRLGLLADALEDTERRPVAGLTAALTETSRIAARKHQWIRLGLCGFCAGVVLLPVSLLVG